MVDNTLPGLFESGESFPQPRSGQPGSVPAGKGREVELSALDEMFRSSGHYRRSRDFMEMVEFISRFRHYSPFNCLLVYIQDPSALYFASISDWEHKFGRYPKRKARPLVALKPFGPVMFLYSLEETEGKPVPEDVINPFKTDGYLPGYVLSNTIHNCSVHGIEVRPDLKGLGEAGLVTRLDADSRRKYADLKLSPDSSFLIFLNPSHEVEEQYSSLVHELAHVFCGHLGSNDDAWWASNQGQSLAIVETEAESVSYLICQRCGLKTTSDKYLSAYRLNEDTEVPLLGLNAVLQATDYIEKMGEARWKKPQRKPKRER
jgi:hypothetical protein